MTKMNFDEQPLLLAMNEAGITHKTERAMLLAQVAHECDNFNAPREYSDGTQYEGREDLGNIHPGDGPKYRGRGYIQLTGRANYEHFGNKIGRDLVNNPDLAADPKIAAEIAIAYWKERVDQKAAQAGDIETVTRNINGGLNGLEDRKLKFGKYMHSTPEAEASNGVTLPSKKSVTAVAEDLKAAGNTDLAKKISDIEQSYQNQTLTDAKQIGEVLGELKKEISKIYQAQGIPVQPYTNMLGMHLGPHSSAAILKADKAAPLKSVKGIHDPSLKAFYEEMKEAGVKDLPSSYDAFKDMPVEAFKYKAYDFYQIKMNDSIQLGQRQRSNDPNALSNQEKTQKEFFQNVIKNMPDGMGILLLFIGLAFGGEEFAKTIAGGAVPGSPTPDGTGSKDTTSSTLSTLLAGLSGSQGTNSQLPLATPSTPSTLASSNTQGNRYGPAF